MIIGYRTVLKATAVISAAALLIIGIAGAAPTKKKDEEPPVAFNLQLPPGAEQLQATAGKEAYKVPMEIMALERYYEAVYPDSKDMKKTARTVGSTRIIICEDLGQRLWSTYQISGVVLGRTSYLIINGDAPATIDKFP